MGDSAAAPAAAALPTAASLPLLRDQMTALASRCHAHLLLIYATPASLHSSSTLIRTTEAAFARLHWLWHHALQRPDRDWHGAQNERAQRLLCAAERRADDPAVLPLQRGADALATLDALCRLLHQSDAAAAGCCSPPEPDPARAAPVDPEAAYLSSLEYCSYYCQQLEFEESRFAKLRQHQEREAAKQAARQAAGLPADDEDELDGKENSDDDLWAQPKVRGEVAPPPQPMRRCHADRSCHMQPPMTRPTDLNAAVAAAAAASLTAAAAAADGSAAAAPAASEPEPYFAPYLLLLHSVFLLRILFAYLYNEDLLIPVQPSPASSLSPSSSSATAGEARGEESNAALALGGPVAVPSITRLCITFLSWPAALHAAVHSFQDNLQYCCYAHMIVGLRGRGLGESSSAASGTAAVAASQSSAASTLAGGPAAWSVLDGRVWKRVMDVLKAKLRAGVVTAPALQREVGAMVAAAPGATMTLPFSAGPGPAASSPPAAAPLTLFVLGDSHALTLHSQWLFLLYRRAQRCEWRQMRTFLVVGLKAWHVGLVAAAAERDAAAAAAAAGTAGTAGAAAAVSTATAASAVTDASVAMHQSSVLQRYAALVPAGSTVLLVAGEIDCRSDEGIATAVAKGKHASTAAALRQTVAAYLRGARVLACRHRWARVLVHPVTPPFVRGNKARVASRGWKDLGKVYARAQLIADFNAEIARQIAEMDAAAAAAAAAVTNSGSDDQPAPPPRFQFLDFFAHLCNGSGNGARPTRAKKGITGGSAGAGASGGADASAAAVAVADDPSRYLLHADYTLEGMHLNTKYLNRIEGEMELACDDEFDREAPAACAAGPAPAADAANASSAL